MYASRQWVSSDLTHYVNDNICDLDNLCCVNVLPRNIWKHIETRTAVSKL